MQIDKRVFSFPQILEAIVRSFAKLLPHIQYRNPVMFVAYVGAIFCTFFLFYEYSSFNLQIVIWLWFTVLFANFASSLAEGQGKAIALGLRKTQRDTKARKLVANKEVMVNANSLRKDDLVVCEVGDIIPADGEVIDGIATVDESAITGESAPVIRESGGDRSAVTAGTLMVSDRVVIRVVSEKGSSFLDRMISLIEGARRQKTPNEIALNIVLSALTIIFLLVVVALKPLLDFSSSHYEEAMEFQVSPLILVALLVCLIPTTISALLNAIGIAGIDRLIQCNVIAKSGRAVEAAGDIDLLILDKTGTITLGNRMAVELIPVSGVDPNLFAKLAFVASLADETPEGRSIVSLVKLIYHFDEKDLDIIPSKTIIFSARTRMSGIDTIDESNHTTRMIRKGAVDAVRHHIELLEGKYPTEINEIIQNIALKGSTPLLVSDDNRVVGIIHLKDIVKEGIKERFIELRKSGIRTLMITGDNPLTAGAIAAEAGVDDYEAEATPEIKLERIRSEQRRGYVIAMTGDGTNDAPALAQADVGVAMNTGTQASREAGNMVDLDSSPTKLIDIVKIGKQLLMTRGALTTLSIANDVAKYFALLPAMLGTLYAFGEVDGPLSMLNIMHLNSPHSAILSTVIFNAVIIVMLIPLALKGIPFKAASAGELLRHNLLIYGLGGVILPFAGIKLIDMAINILGLL